MFTTGTTGLGSKPMTLDDVFEAIEKVKALPKPPDQWIVINPQGQMYRGKVEEVIRPLWAAHPLLKPMSLTREMMLTETPNEYWPVKCRACGWRGSSKDTNGGVPIADTGDFSELRCPICDSILIEETDVEDK